MQKILLFCELHVKFVRIRSNSFHDPRHTLIFSFISAMPFVSVFENVDVLFGLEVRDQWQSNINFFFSRCHDFFFFYKITCKNIEIPTIIIITIMLNSDNHKSNIVTLLISFLSFCTLVNRCRVMRFLDLPISMIFKLYFNLDRIVRA